MALVQVYTAPIAAGASHTTGVDLGRGEFNRFSIVFPSTNPLTAAADITAQSSFDGSTYYTIAYSNNPSTATSTLVPWGASRTAWGNNVMCEAALFTRNYFRVKFATAATIASEVYIYAGKD